MSDRVVIYTKVGCPYCAAAKQHYTDQGIAFDEHGVLIDGQHRLLAILDCEIPVVCWVFFGADIADQMVIDDHGRRTPFDALSLSDMDLPFEITKEHVATARSMMKTSQTRVSHQELREFFYRHVKAIQFAYRAVFERVRRQRLTNATLAAALARAWYHEDESRLMEFGEVIYSGTSQGNEDSAAIRLRDWLLTNDNPLGGGGAKYAFHRRCDRAIMAFCQCQPLQKLHPAPKTLYLLPEEQE